MIDANKQTCTSFLLLLCLCFGCESTRPAKPLTTEGVCCFADDGFMLFKRLDHPTPVIEEPSLWLVVINEPSFSPRHRRRCMMQFFRRQIPLGMPLSTLLKFDGVTSWFTGATISDATYGFGGIFEGTQTKEGTRQSIFVMEPRLPTNNTSAIYLKISEGVSRDDFVNYMTGKSQPPSGLRIIELACHEDER
jgi:hypothetical protein